MGSAAENEERCAAMWLLPWEKLPPLVLGPLAIVVGIAFFLMPEFESPARHLDALLWGIGYVVAGIAITGYGLWKESRREKE